MSVGGLIQVVASSSNQDIMLTHNPSKTFFNSTYAKYTNFAMQKFTLDFEGQTQLSMTESSTFNFKVKRYADLLMDTHLCITLPHIYSPVMHPDEKNGNQWTPYEFKWIKHIGVQIIESVSVTCGSQTLQEYSGDYILNQVERDFSQDKKELFYKMIGHVKELYDPANSGTRVNSYPNAYFTSFPLGSEPSIRSRDLFIPLNPWFMLKPSMAFPLIALQYNELEIHVTFRPVKEWFTIRDVFDLQNNFPYVAPNMNQYYMQFYRFLQTPPQPLLGTHSYVDKRTNWRSQISLLSTFCYLSNEESRQFALKEHSYLIKQVKKDIFYNLCGPAKVQIDAINMVPNIMFFFQRSDTNLRNEWSNYSNWPYDYLPNDLIPAPSTGLIMSEPYDQHNDEMAVTGIGPGINFDGRQTGLMLTGNYSMDNQYDILNTFSILFDGSYREDTLSSGVFNYVEKYLRSSGSAKDGLYCYNFCINTSPFDLQPSGAVNMTRFNKVELEINTIIPSIDANSQTVSICDPNSGNVIGITKPTWRVYEYTFNLTVFQERYNMLNFTSGNCGLAFAT
jgi:Major capsid protein N-terminus/Large eukaryotic DNA virus major capsid protein